MSVFCSLWMSRTRMARSRMLLLVVPLSLPMSLSLSLWPPTFTPSIWSWAGGPKKPPQERTLHPETQSKCLISKTVPRAFCLFLECQILPEPHHFFTYFLKFEHIQFMSKVHLMATLSMSKKFANSFSSLFSSSTLALKLSCLGPPTSVQKVLSE